MLTQRPILALNRLVAALEDDDVLASPAEGDVALLAAVGSPTKRHAACGNDRGILG